MFNNILDGIEEDNAHALYCLEPNITAYDPYKYHKILIETLQEIDKRHLAKFITAYTVRHPVINGGLQLAFIFYGMEIHTTVTIRYRSHDSDPKNRRHPWVWEALVGLSHGSAYRTRRYTTNDYVNYLRWLMGHKKEIL